MRKYFFLFFLFWIIKDFTLAQFRPENYQIGIANKLHKISDDNPASNSISDILTLG